MSERFFSSEDIEQNSDKLQNTSEHHKEVKNRVHIAMFPSQSVQHRSHRVGNAAGEQPPQSRRRDRLNGGLCRHNDTPTHTDIADHGQRRVFFEVNGGEGAAECCTTPHHPEQHPRPDRVVRAKRTQGDRSVGAADEQVYGTVVDHLHHLFADRRVQAVVHAGHGIQ